MKITGYKLQHTLRELAHRRDTAAARFDKVLWKFEDQDKATPQQIMKAYRDAEVTIAKLQTAQGRYNLAITVNVLSETMTLAEAVKRVGGAGRMEKMWRSIAAPKKDRYSYREEENTRDPHVERATRQVSEDEAAVFAQQAARFASALREAIQVANATEIEIELDPALFE